MHTDATHLADSKEYPNMKISARMIMEDFNGPEGIMEALFTNSKTGIEGSDQDLADRTRIYGANAFAPPEIKTIWALILENFEDRVN